MFRLAKCISASRAAATRYISKRTEHASIYKHPTVQQPTQQNINFLCDLLGFFLKDNFKARMIDYDTAIAKSRKVYEPLTTDTEEKLLKLLSICEVDKKYADDVIVSLRKSLEQTQDELNATIIPLTVRHFAFLIENRCPVEFVVPDTELQNAKSFDKEALRRTHQWKTILRTYPKDLYVKFVLKECKNHFKLTNKVDVIEGPNSKEFDQFLLDFSHSIVKAIEKANKLVAHYESEGCRIEALERYSRPVDEYVTLFYNAMVGYKK